MRKAAFCLYLVFVVSWFLHGAARYPVLGQIRFDLLLAALITLLILLSRREAGDAVPSRAIRAWIVALAV